MNARYDTCCHIPQALVDGCDDGRSYHANNRRAHGDNDEREKAGVSYGDLGPESHL
jgi:hypothetical protein